MLPNDDRNEELKRKISKITGNDPDDFDVQLLHVSSSGEADPEELDALIEKIHDATGEIPDKIKSDILEALTVAPDLISMESGLSLLIGGMQASAALFLQNEKNGCPFWEPQKSSVNEHEVLDRKYTKLLKQNLSKFVEAYKKSHPDCGEIEPYEEFFLDYAQEVMAETSKTISQIRTLYRQRRDSCQPD